MLLRFYRLPGHYSGRPAYSGRRVGEIPGYRLYKTEVAKQATVIKGMLPLNSIYSKFNGIAAKPKVWVLAPHLHTGDANVDYYYDFSQSIQEYTKAFAELGIEWKWQPVTMQD